MRILRRAVIAVLAFILPDTDWLFRRARWWEVSAVFLGYAAVPYVVRFLFSWLT